jgi:transcriptional regulator GlxA family with amidase domain
MREILILIFPGTNLLDVAGPAQVFTSATEIGASLEPDEGRLYRTTLVSARGGAIETTAGIVLHSRAIGDVEELAVDTLLIAGGHGSQTAAENPELRAWLGRMQPRVRRLGSVCTGAFLLAAAGLAEGRRVATHWAYCDRLSAAYPQLEVERDAIFVEDDGIWSTAGITSGLDLALAMVEADWGRELALMVSRQLVVFLKRPGGQSQFSIPLQAQTVEGPLAKLIKAVAEDPAADHRVEHLAARAHVSPRTLHRLFRDTFGCSPAQWVAEVRLEAARRQLETGAERLERVAEMSGFPSYDAMRRAFVGRLGLAPSTYRDRFSSGSRPAHPALQLGLHGGQASE